MTIIHLIVIVGLSALSTLLITQTSWVDRALLWLRSGRRAKNLKSMAFRVAEASAKEAEEWQRVRLEADEAAATLKEVAEAWKPMPKKTTNKRAPRKPKTSPENDI